MKKQTKKQIQLKTKFKIGNIVRLHVKKSNTWFDENDNPVWEPCRWGEGKEIKARINNIFQNGKIHIKTNEINMMEYSVDPSWIIKE